MPGKHKLITVRIDLKSAQQISAQLKDFGSTSMSDFVRLAINEKLERTQIFAFVSEHISNIEYRQRKIDSALAKFLKNNHVLSQNMMVMMTKTSNNIAKIAGKI